MADSDDIERETHHRVRDSGRFVRGMLAGVVLAALIAVGIDNRHEVRVGWVFGDADAQLWFVVESAAVAGALIGSLITHRPHHH